MSGGALVGAQFVLIEHGDQIPGVHSLAVIHGKGHDAAGDLAAHYHLVAIHGAGEDQSLWARTLSHQTANAMAARMVRRMSRRFMRKTSGIDCKPNYLEFKAISEERRKAMRPSPRLGFPKLEIVGISANAGELPVNGDVDRGARYYVRMEARKLSFFPNPLPAKLRLARIYRTVIPSELLSRLRRISFDCKDERHRRYGCLGCPR
ncbi:MAG: hypothetical protein WDO73_07485 [Ignavibacteriota bacterium]